MLEALAADFWLPAMSSANQMIPAAQSRAIHRLLKIELVRIGIMREVSRRGVKIAFR
ncbi:MAG TPA: hypothetical protein VFL74_04815 [Sphingomicrobium sp.]|nr:hypothetical protein [Sphingomicrobium sp.]